MTIISNERWDTYSCAEYTGSTSFQSWKQHFKYIPFVVSDFYGEWKQLSYLIITINDIGHTLDPYLKMIGLAPSGNDPCFLHPIQLPRSLYVFIYVYEVEKIFFLQCSALYNCLKQQRPSIFSCCYVDNATCSSDTVKKIVNGWTNGFQEMSYHLLRLKVCDVISVFLRKS